MSNTSEFKQHISIDERNKWDKCVADFNAHLGSGGVENHKLGDGNIPGFSTNDYTNEEKTKLSGIEDGALNNPHPSTHPWSMIEGLSTVGHTGSYKDLLDIPSEFNAGSGNSDTVGGIRFTINDTAPANPKNEKDVWFDTENKLVKVYYGDAWVDFCAVFG